MRFGSLFAGIGGLDLGLERAGMECVWQVEIDDYATRVLEKHWPDVRRWRDVRDFPPDPVGEWKVDLICGGFPCQPVSAAGRRQAESDPRWLWPQFRRVLSILRPRIALVENVRGLLTRGAAGVCFDLACLGYDASWDVLSAAEFGAPHLRKRFFIVAYAGSERALLECGWFTGAGRESAVYVDGDGSVREVAPIVADTTRIQQGRQEQRAVGERVGACGESGDVPDTGCELPQERRAGNGNGRGRTIVESPGGSGGWWESEPDVGRVAHGIPSRVDRLRCLGNAVVPQAAEWIGKRILESDVDRQLREGEMP